MKRYLLILIALMAFGLVAIGCSEKAQEPFRDAPQQQGRNTDPARIIEMPDGFSNVAGKCDGLNFVYVIFKGDANRGSISVVPNDPRCSGNR